MTSRHHKHSAIFIFAAFLAAQTNLAPAYAESAPLDLKRPETRGAEISVTQAPSVAAEKPITVRPELFSGGQVLSGPTRTNTSTQTEKGTGYLANLQRYQVPLTPQPTAKIVKWTPGSNGFQLDIQVSPEVAAIDIVYADQITGPWKTAQTISITPSSATQILKWLDDGTLTGVKPSEVPQRFYQVRIRSTVSDIPLPVISQISISEAGLTTDIPYYLLTYQVTDEKGITQNRTQPLELKAGANDIVIREVNSVGKETVIHRTITFEDPQAKLTDSERVFRQNLLNENARYFSSGIGIDSITGFPLDFIGADAPSGGAPWTQPTAIGFYLQFLADVATHQTTISSMTSAQALLAAKKTMTNLLDAQSRLGWNGLLPWLKVKPLRADRAEIAFLDNVNLSQSIAAMLGAFEKANLQSGSGKEIYQMGVEFLNAQKSGYQRFYDPAARQFYSVYSTADRMFTNFHMDRLGNEARSGVAFVVSYFNLPRLAWDNLRVITRSYVTANQVSIPNLAPFNGSAFQTFWSLLWTPEEDFTTMQPAFKNALVTFQDFMRRNRLPGFPSASSLPEGGYDGNIGIPAIQELSTNPIRSDVGSVYALAAAYRLNPSLVLSLLGEIKTNYPQLWGPNGIYDAASRENGVSKNYYAIDQGSLWLGISGSGASSMKTFLQSRGLWTKLESLYQNLKMPVLQTTYQVPPLAARPGLFETFDGNSKVQSITGTDGAYKFKRPTEVGLYGSTALQVDYTKSSSALYSHIKVQTDASKIRFSDYKGLKFQFKKLSPGPVSILVKFEVAGGGGYIEKKFTIAAGTTGWQEILYPFPAGSTVPGRTTSFLIFADPGNGTTKGSFLIDDIELV